MNKNKIIFAIIWVILVIWIILVILNLKKTSDTSTTKSAWVLNIWTIWDKAESFNKVVEAFKKANKEYDWQEVKVESFWSYDDYFYSLNSAIISGKAPDIFVMNNNEKHSTFSEQVVWISPDTVNPNDFRKKYKWVFADDLIISNWEWDKKSEYLLWIPVWYEALWIYYNRKYVKESELSSISSLNNLVAELKSSKPDITPIWIWNGSTVYWVSDILTQFLMLESWVSSLDNVSWDKLKQWLAWYMIYWDVDWDNAYNKKMEELNKSSQTSLDMFSKWETFMVVGYPRLIEEIQKKWFSKNFLLASVFPHYVTWDWKALINYNYFVINKDSKNQALANKFLWYLVSDAWATEYLKNYKYYLPALLSLESDKLQEKINDDYNIILWNFLSSDYELSSFDKWVKNIYDKDIISILDNPSWYEEAFKKFRAGILCKAKKISTLESLSTSCD